MSDENMHADVKVEVDPGSGKRKKTAAFRVERDGKYNFIKTPMGSYPMGSWWVIVAMFLLLPLMPFAAVFWFFGWVIALRFRDQEQPPRDAVAFKWIARTLFRIFWLPQMLYFRFQAPVAYRSWRESSAVKVGTKAAKKAEEKASEFGAKIIFGDDGVRASGEEVKDAERL